MIPTFIISILESQRNERAYQIVKNSTLPISIFPGVSINEVKIEGDNIYYCNELIHYNREKCLNLHNRLLSPGEIGCALSNYKLYQTCVQQNLSAILILEDDFEFTTTETEICEILDNLPDPSNFDLCYVQTSPPDKYPKIKPYNKYFYQTDRAYARTHGYIITNRFAREILKSFELHSAADGYLARKTQNDSSYVVYVSYQRFVGLSTLAQESDIERVNSRASLDNSDIFSARRLG